MELMTIYIIFFIFVKENRRLRDETLLPRGPTGLPRPVCPVARARLC